jgi:OPA family sugar phosphate sensor protein UhpC-like MFS transporter
MIYLDYLLMFTIGFFIFGPQMLIGMAAAELSHKKAAGSASGFTGWIAYLGAATAGYPMSKVIESSGWYGFFVVLAISSVIASFLLLPLWRIKTNPKYSAEKPAPEEQEFATAGQPAGE